jgi:hypothetical protein
MIAAIAESIAARAAVAVIGAALHASTVLVAFVEGRHDDAARTVRENNTLTIACVALGLLSPRIVLTILRA